LTDITLDINRLKNILRGLGKIPKASLQHFVGLYICPFLLQPADTIRFQALFQCPYITVVFRGKIVSCTVQALVHHKLLAMRQKLFHMDMKASSSRNANFPMFSSWK